MKNDVKGVYNRTFIFWEEEYVYWKECTNVYLMFIDLQTCLVVEESPFVPKRTVFGSWIDKFFQTSNYKKIKKISNDMQARNILICALSVNEYFSISHYKTTKKIWDVLQVL